MRLGQPLLLGAFLKWRSGRNGLDQTETLSTPRMNEGWAEKRAR
jgi:hypothetical protein